MFAGLFQGFHQVSLLHHRVNWTFLFVLRNLNQRLFTHHATDRDTDQAEQDLTTGSGSGTNETSEVKKKNKIRPEEQIKPTPKIQTQGAEHRNLVYTSRQEEKRKTREVKTTSQETNETHNKRIKHRINQEH